MHPTTRRPSYVLVELKQWTNAEPCDDELVHDPALRRSRCSIPPSRSAGTASSSSTSRPSSRRARRRARHRLPAQRRAEGWRLPQYQIDEFGRLYTRDERAANSSPSLRRLLDTDPETRPTTRGESADDLLAARTEPSRQLLAVAAEEIKHREQFVLLDEQQVAFQTGPAGGRAGRRENTKTVVIVLGGPGSGKSVVALSLLGELSRPRPPRAARDRLELVHQHSAQDRRRFAQQPRAQQLFIYFNSFIGERAEHARRADLRRGTPHPRDERQPLHRRPTSGRRQAAGRGADRRRPRRRCSCSTNTRWCARRDGHRARRSARRPRRPAAGSRSSGWRASSAAAAQSSTTSGCCGSSGSTPLPRRRGPTLTRDSDETYRVAALPSPDALESWLVAQNPGRRDTARIAAGYCWRGATRRSSTARSAGRRRRHRRLAAAMERQAGQGRARRPSLHISGPATRVASARSAASTRRRASSTTGPA